VVVTRSRPLARPKGWPIYVAGLPPAPLTLRRNAVSETEAYHE